MRDVRLNRRHKKTLNLAIQGFRYLVPETESNHRLKVKYLLVVSFYMFFRCPQKGPQYEKYPRSPDRPMLTIPTTYRLHACTWQNFGTPLFKSGSRNAGLDHRCQKIRRIYEDRSSGPVFEAKALYFFLPPP